MPTVARVWVRVSEDHTAIEVSTTAVHATDTITYVLEQIAKQHRAMKVVPARVAPHPRDPANPQAGFVQGAVGFIRGAAPLAHDAALELQKAIGEALIARGLDLIPFENR